MWDPCKVATQSMKLVRHFMLSFGVLEEGVDCLLQCWPDCHHHCCLVGPTIWQHQILRLQLKKEQKLVLFWTRLDPRPVVDRPQYLGGRGEENMKMKSNNRLILAATLCSAGGPADYELLHTSPLLTINAAHC